MHFRLITYTASAPVLFNKLTSEKFVNASLFLGKDIELQILDLQIIAIFYYLQDQANPGG